MKELGPDAIFVGIPEPLPVGTLVTLKIGDVVREARVDDVVESAEPSAAGMRVRFGGAPAAKAVPAAAPAPAPAPAAKAAPAPEPAAPVVESAPVAAIDSGPSSAIAAEAGDEGSGAIPAPLSLAGGSGDSGQHGGKRRRKRR